MRACGCTALMANLFLFLQHLVVSSSFKQTEIPVFPYFSNISSAILQRCQLCRIQNESPGLPYVEPLHHCQLTPCLYMYPIQNNFGFLNSPRRFLRYFLRLSDLLTTKPHLEGNQTKTVLVFHDRIADSLIGSPLTNKSPGHKRPVSCEFSTLSQY